ncbi:unnamed protein product [Adineta ricciae]|uniref:Uncharacterized protein n=1 Tax=Adineta ricciae TaxID=249248 RepID=A0A815ILZ7_ADIRI|nr:unnamed protein product [Adineta ricciae]CAF1370136.1 unnamed protein product [Adineta ricciae]
MCHSTPSLTRSYQLQRPIDCPSMEKHYGIVTFSDYQLPIIYRLINESFYIPYIRFSYVLNIFERSSYKKFTVNINNLPVIEMTPIERVYYDEISPFVSDSDWSHYQLLSVSVFDGVLAILNLTEHFHSNSSEENAEWQEAMNRVRQAARDRWILDEKVVLTRLAEQKQLNPTCISSTSIAKRRALFEQRLDLSIIDETGGFLQIDSYVYPFVKNPSDQQIYINVDDIRQNCIPISSCLICYSNENSPMYRAYSILTEHAQTNSQWSAIHHDRTRDLAKYLPSGKRMDENLCKELAFVRLQTVLHLFLTKSFNLRLQFVQLFETPSLKDIEMNYKTSVARQFILIGKRRSGLVDNQTPCVIYSENNREIVSIPSELATQRSISDDERLYLNMILLYNGLWKNVLTKKKQWYWKEIGDDEKENFNIEILSM